MSCGNDSLLDRRIFADWKSANSSLREILCSCISGQARIPPNGHWPTINMRILNIQTRQWLGRGDRANCLRKLFSLTSTIARLRAAVCRHSRADNAQPYAFLLLFRQSLISFSDSSTRRDSKHNFPAGDRNLPSPCEHTALVSSIA